MASLNVWTGTGHLTRDPETKVIASGKSITSFGIGVSCGYGERKSSLFLNVEAWEKLGAFVQQYASKGSQVAVTGELHCRTYTNKDGVEKQVWEIKAREVEVLTKSNGSGRTSAADSKVAATYNESGEINF